MVSIIRLSYYYYEIFMKVGFKSKIKLKEFSYDR